MIGATAGAVALRVTQAEHQGSMSAHGMTGETQALRIQGQVCAESLRKLVDHVAVHPVVLLPRRLFGIHVEASAMAEIPMAIWVARHRFAAGAGVGHDESQSELGGQSLGAGLLHRVFIVAGETRQPDQRWPGSGTGTSPAGGKYTLTVASLQRVSVQPIASLFPVEAMVGVE